MTPELEKQIIIACVGVFFSALFTGFPAILLFWWTWRRDQERIKVQKQINFMDTLDGKKLMVKDAAGIPDLGILIRNRSLFPVRVSAAGFEIDGNVIPLEHPHLRLRLKRNPDQNSNRPNIPDDSDPGEIMSGASIWIKTVASSDKDSLKNALCAASSRYDISLEELVLSSKVVALVALESGRGFSSITVKGRIWKTVFGFFEIPLRKTRKAWKQHIANKCVM
jgi:hypothetical protein